MLGDRMYSLRTAHNMTQVQLANTLGVSKQSISNWEKGNILPSIDMLCRIADVFSVRTDYLLGRSDDSYLQIEGLRADQVATIQKMISYLQEVNKKADDTDAPA